MRWDKRAAVIGVLVAAVLAGCGPEAGRTRGGGPGADIGNHGAPVELHGQPNPFYRAPVVGRGVVK